MVRAVKRPIRIGLGVLAGLAVPALAAVILCLDGVDGRPYAGQGYYAETDARLRSQAHTNHPVRGELAAGFGRARLTPAIHATQDAPAKGEFRSLPLAGYGNRHGKPASGVHDDLWVKAIALRVRDRIGVMVGADALIIPPEVTERVARQLQQALGLQREQIYLGATHTHSGVGGWGEGIVGELFAGGFQPEARNWLAGQIVAAARDAVNDLKPARFGHGQLMAPQYIRNRLAGGLRKVDPEFSYAVVEQDGGGRAVLGVYGAHATTLSADMMEFSGDYPGVWQRAVEQATGGMALFFAGGVGSHSPVPGAKGMAGAEQMGQALARMVIEHLPQTALTNTVTLAIAGLDITMPPVNVRVSDGIRLRPWLAARLVPARSQSFLQVFRLDDSIWVSTPCDFSGELAMGIKEFVRARGASAAVTSFNGDYIGYLIPSRYYHLDGYEPRLMSFFGPNTPDYFDELIRGMSLALMQN